MTTGGASFAFPSLSRGTGVFAVAVLAVLAPADAARGAERLAADIACAPAGEALVYDCTIAVRRAASGAPLEGGRITVGADMPSMPMAHRVRPVAAEPAGRPGVYRARLRLEMAGDWAVQVTAEGPVRDRIVKVLRFGDRGAPDPPAGAPHRH
jgi:hypothetical protein